MKSIAILCIFLFCAGVCPQSATPSQQAWPQEPSSFLGIKFGVPLAASVPECPKHDYGNGVSDYDWPDFGRPCFEPVGGFYEVYNEPQFFDAFVTEVAGKVESISLAFKASGADTIATALTERFGPAHQHATETKQNNAGAQFEDRVLVWKGKNIEIDFHSLGTQVDRGDLEVYTSTYVDYQTQQEKEKKDSLSGVL